jgi:putative membrane protein
MTSRKSLKIGVFDFLSILFLGLVPNMAYARGGYGGYGGWGMGPGIMGGWGMGWWGIVPMLLFWAVIIVAIVFFVKWLAHGSGKNISASSSDSRSLEILKERFARGEITKEEFEHMKKVIQD